LEISNRKTSILYDLTRVLLIPLSLIVLTGLLLVLLPQSISDRLAAEVRSRRNVSARGEIALLYLGHRVSSNQFQIRGVVRNITAEPINQLDAAIRLYGHNRELRETAIVRMEKETIAPGEIARFELVYPDYESEFSSYSVEFKLRSGTVLPYQDMREPRTKISQSKDTR
jgi:hypothetical protein